MGGTLSSYLLNKFLRNQDLGLTLWISDPQAVDMSRVSTPFRTKILGSCFIHNLMVFLKKSIYR